MTPTQTGDKPMVTLPETAPGHWDTPEGREKAIEYLSKTREQLCMGDRSDLALANAQYLEDISVGTVTFQSAIGMQTAAKERIRWLSVQLAAANAELAAHRAQETLSPEQPLETIQRLGQEFDAPEATPSLGMGENERAALVRAAEFLDSCAGADIEVDGVTAISVVEELHSLLPETWDDCFHVEAARYLEHLTSPSPDVGLAEENERLREALEDTQATLSAVKAEAIADGGGTCVWIAETLNQQMIDNRATLQSISTGNP